MYNNYIHCLTSEHRYLRIHQTTSLLGQMTALLQIAVYDLKDHNGLQTHAQLQNTQ